MTSNPFYALDPATLSVLDDMADAWADKAHHGILREDREYGDGRMMAFWAMRSQITDAYRAQVGNRSGKDFD
ncbi:hypothetical protein ACIPT3_02330 [Streptomyces diastaticus]|uniref:hypothetical protein n=1 Tax=Streptomyces diastaticus TaxID=1956 RepID=UPI00380B88CD